jgi:hypothetical protein
MSSSIILDQNPVLGVFDYDLRLQLCFSRLQHCYFLLQLSQHLLRRCTRHIRHLKVSGGFQYCKLVRSSYLTRKWILRRTLMQATAAQRKQNQREKGKKQN